MLTTPLLRVKRLWPLVVLLVALAAVLAVPLLCLGMMLRQELFFARFALPLLPPLAMLAGIGVVGLVRLAGGGW